MANWKYKIDMVADWRLATQRAIDAKELAKRVAAKLKTLNVWDMHLAEELETIVNDFEVLSQRDDLVTFDEVYEALCDWGDTEVAPYGQWPRNKLCWIGVI